MAEELTDEEVKKLLEELKNDWAVKAWKNAGHSDREGAGLIREFL